LSTISQNNIVVNYVITSDQIAKTKNEFDKLTDAEKKAVDETKKLNDSLKKTGQEGSQSVKNVGNEMNNLSGIVKSGAGLLAGYFSVSALLAFKDRLVETTIKFQGYSKAIEFGSGSAANFARNQQFLNDLINKYGLGLASTTEAYKSFFNASTLAGQSQQETNRQFEAVTKAGTVLKLTTDQMQGAFLALGQMMSKGTVQSEELRQQLGERIPGAITIMARALGVSEIKLNKMLEQGQVLSKDALPKFAAELEKTFGPGAEKNLNGLVNAQNRFNSSIDGLVLAIGTRLEPFLRGSYELAAGIANQLKRLYDPLAASFEKGAEAGKKASEEALKIAIVNQNAKLRKLQQEFDIKAEVFAIDGQMSALEQAELDKTTRKYELEKKFRDGLMVNLTRFEQEKKIKEEIAGLTDAELKALKEQYQARLKLLDLEEKIALTKAKIKFEDPLQLERESYLIKKKFTDLKIALDIDAAKAGIPEAKEASQLRQAEIELVAENVIRANNEEVKSIKDKIADIQAEEKKLADKRKANQEEQTREQNKTNKELIELEEEKAKKFKEIDEKSAKEKEKLKKEIAEMDAEILTASFDLAVNTTNGLFNLQSQYAARDMARKQKQFDEEIRLADGNVQKITEIEERRRIAEREYRQKEFRANQQQAIANIIFAAAPEIIKNIKNPVLLGLITAGVILQTGLVLAQPVPEFAEGTKGKPFKGRAIVGEKGTEKVITQSGKVYYTPGVATLAQFDEPVQIIPNNQLGINDKRQLSLIYGNTSRTNDSGGRIIEKLSNIESGLKNMPVAAISLDERGFMKKVRTPNRSTTILNNRFKN
jgi:tape measure domain-containing protein